MTEHLSWVDNPIAALPTGVREMVATGTKRTTSPVTRLTEKIPKTNRSRKHVKATLGTLASIATTSMAKKSSTKLGDSRERLVQPFPVYKSHDREGDNKKQRTFCILNWTVQRMEFLIR